MMQRSAPFLLPLRTVLAGWQDGDEQGWVAEFAYLREHHQEHLRLLRSSIRTHGIQHGVLLGPDGRVWDGHHRLCVADELQLDHVPVDLRHCVDSRSAG